MQCIFFLFAQKAYFFNLLLIFILASEQLVLYARGLILRVTLKIKNLHLIIMGKIFKISYRYITKWIPIKHFLLRFLEVIDKIDYPCLCRFKP